MPDAHDFLFLGELIVDVRVHFVFTFDLLEHVNDLFVRTPM